MGEAVSTTSENLGAPITLTPIDYDSPEIKCLLYFNGSAAPNFSRISQIDFKKASDYFKKLQDEMYQKFKTHPSVSASKFLVDSAYDTPTDNVGLVVEILEALKKSNRINSVATVMGFNWPEIMKRCFGDLSRITSFDLNRAQHILSGPEAAKYGPVCLADIAVPEISDAFLKGTKPDLLFLSNIPDFMNASESEDVAQTIINNQVKAVLISEDVTGKRFWGSHYASQNNAFSDALTRGRVYDVKTKNCGIDKPAKYDINTFHIFTLNT